MTPKPPHTDDQGSDLDQELARELASLLRRAGQGDPSAWSDLIHRYTDRVYALLVSRCRDGELAEELTQATFVKVVARLQEVAGYEERGRFEPWLFRVAMNTLRDEMRRRGRQAVGRGTDGSEPVWDHAASDEPSPLARLDRAEQVDQLRHAVSTLPEADQEVLHLRHTAGLSFAEIAQTLDQPLGTVLARGHRALGKLRKLLQDPAVAAAEDGPRRRSRRPTMERSG